MITITYEEIQELVKKHIKRKYNKEINYTDYHMEFSGCTIRVGKVIMAGPAVTQKELTKSTLSIFKKVTNNKGNK